MQVGLVGSINLDLLYNVKKPAALGETVFGERYKILSGGKGSNQAVMLNALGNEVIMLGAVGEDVFAAKALAELKKRGINTKHILTKKASTGVAFIQTTQKDNSITVIPGANNAINFLDIDNFLNQNKDLKLIVAQLEINFSSVVHLIDECYKRGIKIILNPAPAVPLNKTIIEKVDYLIPNETETKVIFNHQDPQNLVERYQGKLLITKGELGVLYYGGGKVALVPARKIDVVDTTGAGDAFVAGFTTGVVRGYKVKKSIELGIEVASIVCLTEGAQTAYEKVKKKVKV